MQNTTIFLTHKSIIATISKILPFFFMTIVLDCESNNNIKTPTESSSIYSGSAIVLSPAWQENFNQLDRTGWDVQLFSFPANGCNMLADHVHTQNNTLLLSLDINQKPTANLPKMCNAGEIGSLKIFTYGLFVVKMKPPAISGGVAAFFLMNQWVEKNWEHKEIDIEFLGKNSNSVQLTTHDFQNGGRDWKSAATTVNLGFDNSVALHEYAILWTQSAVQWYVDGKKIHTETHYVPHVPLQIHMNIYLGDPTEKGITSWLGPIDTSKLPASAYYKQIEYYPVDALPAGYIK